MKLKLLLISSALLAGCATTPALVPDPVVIHKPVFLDCGTPPQRDHIELRLVSWQVIDGRYTLSGEEFVDNSYNWTETEKGIKQLQIEIRYYEDCINGQSKTSD